MKPLTKRQIIRNRVIALLVFVLVMFGLGFGMVREMNGTTPSLEQSQLDEQQECIDIGGVPVVIPNETVLQGYKLVCTHEQTEVRKSLP